MDRGITLISRRMNTLPSPHCAAAIYFNLRPCGWCVCVCGVCCARVVRAAVDELVGYAWPPWEFDTRLVCMWTLLQDSSKFISIKATSLDQSSGRATSCSMGMATMKQPAPRSGRKFLAVLRCPRSGRNFLKHFKNGHFGSTFIALVSCGMRDVVWVRHMRDVLPCCSSSAASRLARGLLPSWPAPQQAAKCLLPSRHPKCLLPLLCCLLLFFGLLSFLPCFVLL